MNEVASSLGEQGRYVGEKNLTIKGQAKKSFELNLSDCTWFSNWDEPQFIRSQGGWVIQVSFFIPKRWILSFERKEK